MFRFRRSVKLPRERQAYIHYKSLCLKLLSLREQDRIVDLCSRCGGEHWRALLEFVSTDKGKTAVCLQHNVSEATLERCVRRYYEKWPKMM